MKLDRCRICGSLAVNPGRYNRDPGVDLDLCDVHYWEVRARQAKNQIVTLKKENDALLEEILGSDEGDKC